MDPGHVNVSGNEASMPCPSQLPPQPMSLSSALSYINRNIQDSPIKHETTAAVCAKVYLLTEHTVMEFCRDSILLARVWSGHCSTFNTYQRLIDLTVDRICARRGLRPQTVEHWLIEIAHRQMQLDWKFLAA